MHYLFQSLGEIKPSARKTRKRELNKNVNENQKKKRKEKKTNLIVKKKNALQSVKSNHGLLIKIWPKIWESKQFDASIYTLPIQTFNRLHVKGYSVQYS